MRKTTLLLSVFLVISAFLHANPVDQETAKTIGAKFLKASTEMKNVEVNDLEFVTAYTMSDGNDAFYVFNAENGFVIVAADDCATPILGYSTESQFVTDDIPVQMQEYLSDFVEQIEYGIAHETFKDDKTIRQWELVKTTGKTHENKNAKVVQPLLTTTWHQKAYYNDLCPEDSEGYNGHVAAGCVATAMGQIMKYWDKPVTGTGSHSYTHAKYGTLTADFGNTTYDWDNMPVKLTSSSSPAEVEAVATLLYHCGVAVEMNYGPESSGANSLVVPDVMQTYFGYSNEMSNDYRQYYSDDIWLKKIKASLESTPPCPVFYTGQDVNGKGGHAFICDGYDANDKLHINWGWDGSSNGYFSVTALNVSGYQFNRSNIGIFNIHPNGVTVTASYAITASSNNMAYGTAAISGMSPYSIGTAVTVTATAQTGYSFLYWTDNGSVVSTDAIYTFKAEYPRDLVAQFADESTLCDIVFELQDTYGDGWHVNVLEVTYADNNIEHLTLKQGHNEAFTRKVENGSAIGLRLIPNIYYDLIQFFIKTSDDKILYENTDVSGNYSDTYTVDLTSGYMKYYFTGAVDEKWSDPDNWISKVKPSASSDAVIKTIVEVDEDATVASLTMDNYTRTFIDDSAILTVTGAITQLTDAYLIIYDGCQLVQSNSGIDAYVGKRITEWTTTDIGWNAISSPVNEVSFNSIQNLTSSTYNVYSYDEATTTWLNSQHTGNTFSTLANGRGYLYRKSDERSLYFTGELNVANVEYQLSYTPAAGDLAGFHLIGNPYSHNIKKGVEIANTYLETGFYTLKPDGTWEAGTDNLTEISPCQAILVQAKNTVTDEKLIISNAVSKGSKEGYYDFISLSLSSNDYSDIAYAIFNGGNHGLNKIDHRNDEIQKVYINYNDENFAIAEMYEETSGFNLNFKAQTMGHYTLKLDYQGDFSYIQLFDKFTGEVVDMLVEDEYSFIGSPSDSEARFIVRLGKKDNYSDENEFFAYQNGNEVIVNGNGLLEIYDAMGRLVETMEIHDNETIYSSSLPSGVYIFRITGDSIRTQKIVIQ